MTAVETVLVIPRVAFHELFPPGLRFAPPGSDPADAARRARRLLARCVPAPRTPTLEADPGRKQIVIYPVLRWRGRSVTRFWAYRRVGCGEGRLEGLISLGVGGHVRAADAGSAGWPPEPATLRRAAVRELNEELPDLRYRDLGAAGYVNDEGDAVGRCHLGVCCLADVLDPDSAVPPQRAGLEPVGWKTAVELWRMRETGAPFEGWSAVLLAALGGWSAGSAAGFQRVAP